MKIRFVDGPLAGLLLESPVAVAGGKIEVKCSTPKRDYCLTYGSKKSGLFHFISSSPTYRPATSIEISSIKQWAPETSDGRTVELIGGKHDGMELTRTVWKEVIRHKGLSYEYSHCTSDWRGERYFYRLVT